MSNIEEHYAIKLLTNNFNREPSIVTKWVIPVSFAGLAFIGVCVANMVTKKPMMSGIQKHILLTASFGGFGLIADKYRNDYYAERDAMYRHYISLHPEDFPEPERKKYGDLFLPWTPIR